MKESEVRAICKKHKFSTSKKYTRFQNNHGTPWLHIEDLDGDGFIEWYGEFKLFTNFRHPMTTMQLRHYVHFLQRVAALIEELEKNGITETNVQLGI